MVEKYPAPGDIYQSRLYPGETCKIVRVQEAQVTFQWISGHDHIDWQIAPVNHFIRDFDLQTEVPQNDTTQRP